MEHCFSEKTVPLFRGNAAPIKLTESSAERKHRFSSALNDVDRHVNFLD